MANEKNRITTGVEHLDRILEDLFIGDNVVWYDDVGSLADIFWMNFIRVSEKLNKSIIFISYDRSPKNLIEKLGDLADYSRLVILDCFTFGKGAGSDVFLKFYESERNHPACRIVKVEDPEHPDVVTGVIYRMHSEMEGDVRFVFESLTGMQELWSQEEEILKLYSQACPRLYELNTIAYWIIEKRAHTSRLRAHINKIAQVAIELSLKRGKTALTVLKAENRGLEKLNIPNQYWNRGLEITFDSEKRSTGKLQLGSRIKSFRTRKGFSQTVLARLVGVTPSNISQVENNQIYPSLPALIKIAETLAVDIGAFFQDVERPDELIVFKPADAVQIHNPNIPRDSLSIKLTTPFGRRYQAEPYLVEITPKKNILTHFFIHKGMEIGYVLSGSVDMKMPDSDYHLTPGDVIHLTREIPVQWKNNSDETVRMLWVLVK